MAASTSRHYSPSRFHYSHMHMKSIRNLSTLHTLSGLLSSIHSIYKCDKDDTNRSFVISAQSSMPYVGTCLL